MNDEQLAQRRRPAHPVPIEHFNEPVIVQVNVCTKGRQPILACEAGHRLCREIWQMADFWHVGRYVIMPDHIHLFCTPGRLPMPSLRQWVEYWKGQIAARWPMNAIPQGFVQTDRTDDTEVVPSGNWIGVSGSVPTMTVVSFKLWQRDFWDTQMRSLEHYEENLAYVRMNPIRKELAEDVEEWPYQGEVFPIGWS